MGTYGADGALVIDCAECALEHTDACHDCVVTWLVERDPTTAVVIDAAEVRALRALQAGGLVPTLLHSPRRHQPV
jgi:Zn-finger protein